MTIHTLRLQLQNALRSIGVPFHGTPGDRSKPVGFASILLRFEDVDLELAFGQVGGEPSARLFVLDAKGARSGAGRQVSPVTLHDMLDTMTTPPAEAALRVEAALKGWRVERTRSGLRVERPSSDGPSAPDVVVIREGRAYTASGALVCGDARAATMDGVWSRLRRQQARVQVPEALELDAADVRRAGMDPGPSVHFLLVHSPEGLELRAAIGGGGWRLHPATTLWPSRLRELRAAWIKAAA